MPKPTNQAQLYDGSFTPQELLNIGTGKTRLDLPMTPADLDKGISFVESQEALKTLEGFNEATLMRVAERKMDFSDAYMTDWERAQNNQLHVLDVEAALEPFQKQLGIRTS